MTCPLKLTCNNARKVVYWFPIAIVINCHKLSVFKQQNVLFYSSGNRSLKSDLTGLKLEMPGLYSFLESLEEDLWKVRTFLGSWPTSLC